MIKDNIDLWSIIVGTVASFMKALKKKLDLHQLIIALITGGILAWGTLGLLDLFFGTLEPKVIMLSSFAVGWMANEITDVLDDVVRDFYSMIKVWISNKLKK
jgi:hypothetical protein